MNRPSRTSQVDTQEWPYVVWGVGAEKKKIKRAPVYHLSVIIPIF